jgi:hypothetical protein
MPNRARMLGERNFIVLGLFSTPKRYPSKKREGGDLECAKDGDITDKDVEYAVGNNSNDKPLNEGNKNNDSKYAKDGNIAFNGNKYAIGNDGVDEPLAKGNDKYDTLSTAHA